MDALPPPGRGKMPLVRAYLRASTDKQDATRARKSLITFADGYGQRIAAYFVENETGTTLHRPELMRLLDESEPGDVLLIEQVDRLSRLTEPDWLKLRSIITDRGIHVVALDLPTSHQLMVGLGVSDFTSRMLGVINGMMLDMLAAMARKDYDDRVRRTREGIAKAMAAGKMKGRTPDKALRAKVTQCLEADMPIRRAASVCGCSPTTVMRVKRELEGQQEAVT